MEKSVIRNEIKIQLNSLPLAFYEEASLKIKDTLLQQPSIQKATTIGLTYSRQREVNTKHIIEALWALGKKVALPKCNPKSHEMDFYIVTDLKQLEIVYLDLLEPIPEKSVYISKKEIDVLIVPGVVFDRKGYRIGYGGGYYDRYLTDFQGETISLAFQLQIVNSVPHEEHDLPVSFIITEQETIDCKNFSGS